MTEKAFAQAQADGKPDRAYALFAMELERESLTDPALLEDVVRAFLDDVKRDCQTSSPRTRSSASPITARTSSNTPTASRRTGSTTSTTLNDHVLIAATMDFGALAATKPIEVQLYPIWYFAAHPEKIALPHFKQMQDGANAMFPGLPGLDRPRQKQAGLQALVQALRDCELMTHPSTDRSSVRAIVTR